MRRTLSVILLLACVFALAAGYLPQGPDYSKYDPDKLQERYNIIQALVRPAQTAYRPRIGAAYAKPAAYKGAAAYRNQAYAPYNPYKQPAATRPVYATAKSVGYAPAYSNQAAPVPTQYGGFQSYNGIRFGGGQVHPIFNNALLYKTNVGPKDLGPFDSTAPIFIGGSTKATANPSLRASFNAKPNTNLRASFNAQPNYAYPKQLSPQIDAYNNRPSPAISYPYFG